MFLQINPYLHYLVTVYVFKFYKNEISKNTLRIYINTNNPIESKKGTLLLKLCADYPVVGIR